MNKPIVNFLIILTVLYSLANDKLLANSGLFDKYDQKYNDSSDIPLEKRRLKMLYLESKLKSLSDKNVQNANNIIQVDRALSDDALGLGDLCGALSSVDHNDISICKITLSKNNLTFELPKKGKIVSVVLKGSNRGEMWYPKNNASYVDSSIRIWSPITRLDYTTHDCKWDLGGKSHKLALIDGSREIKSWQVDGVKTYSARYSGVYTGTVTQRGQVASSVSKANNCIFNESGLNISRQDDDWWDTDTIQAYVRANRASLVVKESNLNIRFRAGDDLVFSFITRASVLNTFRCTQSETVAYQKVRWPRATRYGRDNYLQHRGLTSVDLPSYLGKCGDDGTAVILVQYDL